MLLLCLSINSSFHFASFKLYAYWQQLYWDFFARLNPYVSGSSAGLGGCWQFWYFIFASTTVLKLHIKQMMELISWQKTNCPPCVFQSTSLFTCMLPWLFPKYDPTNSYAAAVIDGMVYRSRNEHQGRKRKEEEEDLKAILLLDMNLILNQGLFRYIYHFTPQKIECVAWSSLN